MPASEAWRTPALSGRAVAVGAFVLLAGTAAILLGLGRPPLCTCGSLKLWYGLSAGPETSQQVADPYTFTHMIHGALFYGALSLYGRLRGRPLAFRHAFLTALAAECLWEVVENSPFVVARYRGTAALGYEGDSVLNSLSDIAATATGFWAAARLPPWATATAAVAIEAGLAYLYRDNLTLNVLMLLWPSESIKAWQLGG